MPERVAGPETSVNVTGSPELALAASVIGVGAKAWAGGPMNSITWLALTTVTAATLEIADPSEFVTTTSY